MILTNHTTIPDDYLNRILRDAIDAYADLYDPANSEVEFIIFDSMDELKKVRGQMIDDPDDMDYNGNFVPPKGRTDTLTILGLVKEKNLVGAEQYFMEKENGSLRDADIPDSERAERGVKLMSFFEFVEMIQHEYSHLCSYERLMTATDWADPLILGHDWNYHLHDEFIARYRGTRAMLHMMEPYAENDLFYSLWIGFWNDLGNECKNYIEVVKKFFADRTKTIEVETLMFMKQNRLTGADMAAELEHELGHPLYYGGELTEAGVPRMSTMEIAEFLTFEDTEKMTIPLMYVIRNPFASYHGAQLLGLIQAFHDHFSEGHCDGLEMECVDLVEAMMTPYYEYVEAEKVKKTLDSFNETFTKYCGEAE